MSTATSSRHIVEHMVANTENFKQICARYPLAEQHVTKTGTLLITPIRIYAFDNATVEPLYFDQHSRKPLTKQGSHPILLCDDDVTSCVNPLGGSSSPNFAASRGSSPDTSPTSRRTSGPPQLRLVTRQYASERAALFLSFVDVDTAWINRGVGDDAVVIKCLPPPPDAEDRDTLSRVRLAPKTSTEGAELLVQARRPRGTDELTAASAAEELVQSIIRAVEPFAAKRRAALAVAQSHADFAHEPTEDWADDIRAISKTGANTSHRAKSLARTDLSRKSGAGGNWGNRRCAQMIRDVLSGEWHSLLDLRFDAETTPATGNWEPLFDALRGRVISQEYIDGSRYRPVRLEFESVFDLDGPFLQQFVSVVESNYMRVVSVAISGFSPKFGVAGLEALLALTERETNFIFSVTVAASVVDTTGNDGSLRVPNTPSQQQVSPSDKDAASRARFLFDQIQKNTTRCAMTRKR